MAANPNLPRPSFGKYDLSGLPLGVHGDLIARGDFRLFTHDVVFHGDTIPAETIGITNGTAAALTPTATTGRGLGLVTGTDDDGYAGISTGISFKGDLGVLTEILLELPATITTLKVEAGLTDATDDAGAVLLKATPTATATDFAVFAYDRDDDALLAAISAKGGTVVGSQDLVTPAGSDIIYLAIRVLDDNVQFTYSINGKTPVTVAHGGGAGIEGGTALTPWVFAQARAGAASRTVIVHRIRTTGYLV